VTKSQAFARAYAKQRERALNVASIEATKREMVETIAHQVGYRSLFTFPHTFK